MAGFSRDLISRYTIYFTGVGWLTPPTREHARRHGIWDSRRLLSTANRERHAFESATAWFERTCRSSASAGRDRSLDRLTGGVRSLSRTALDPRGSSLDRTNPTGRRSGERPWIGSVRSRVVHDPVADDRQPFARGHLSRSGYHLGRQWFVFVDSRRTWSVPARCVSVSRARV